MSNAAVVSSVNPVAGSSGHVLLQTARLSVLGRYGVADMIVSGGQWSVFRWFVYALGRTGTTACDWSV